MAKAPKKEEAPATDDPQEEAEGKAKGGKKLLFVAIGLSLLSLGSGFFLARFAFQQDAENYAPDYVEEVVLEEESGEKGKGDEKYAESEDKSKEGGSGGDEEKEATGPDGIMSFDEILTNITSYDQNGAPKSAFLKLKLVMIYRPDPGSEELLERRKPFMRDLFNGYARSLHEADLRGMAGILNVKAELLKRARAAAGSDLPQEILISDLIVQ